MNDDFTQMLFQWELEDGKQPINWIMKQGQVFTENIFYLDEYAYTQP